MMHIPTVNAVGVLETPENFERAPRDYPLATRLLAASILGSFSIVMLWTGALSLARYCLTSDAGAPFLFG
jgi:hypothetical protein